MRRRLLHVAAPELSRDRRVSLAQMAAPAGVGRTTLHRYFPTCGAPELVTTLLLDGVRAHPHGTAADGEGAP